MTEFECTALPVDAVGYIEEKFIEQLSGHLFADHRDGSIYCQEVDAVIHIAGPSKD